MRLEKIFHVANLWLKKIHKSSLESLEKTLPNTNSVEKYWQQNNPQSSSVPPPPFLPYHLYLPNSQIFDHGASSSTLENSKEIQFNNYVKINNCISLQNVLLHIGLIMFYCIMLYSFSNRFYYTKWLFTFLQKIRSKVIADFDNLITFEGIHVHIYFLIYLLKKVDGGLYISCLGPILSK